MDAPISSPSSNSLAASSSQQQQPSPANANIPVQMPTTANAYLDNFTLIAEATKRAQVAIIIRDLEEVGIS